jgi:hypothetical protein
VLGEGVCHDLVHIDTDALHGKLLKDSGEWGESDSSLFYFAGGILQEHVGNDLAAFSEVTGSCGGLMRQKPMPT